MTWSVHYWDEINNRNIRWSDISAPEVSRGENRERNRAGACRLSRRWPEW